MSARPWRQVWQRDLFFPVPYRHLTRTTHFAELREDPADGLLDLAVWDHLDLMVLAPHVASRHIPQHGSSVDHLDPSRVGALLQQPELELAHGALKPQQQPVVQMAGIVDAVVVDQQGIGQSAEIDQMVPVAVVPGQPRGFEREHGPGGTFADGRQQPGEAGAFMPSASRAAEIVVDDLRPLEAEMVRMGCEGVLPLLTFLMVADLLGGRLPDVHVGRPFEMRRPDLLSHLPSVVLSRPEERSRAAGPTAAGSADEPPRTGAPPDRRPERATDVGAWGSVSACASIPPRIRVAQESSRDPSTDKAWALTSVRRLRRAARPIRGRSSAGSWSHTTGSNIHRGTATCPPSGRRITTVSS